MSCCIKRMQGAGDYADVHSECDWQNVWLTSAKICCIHLQEVCILWTDSHPMYLYILFWLSFDRCGSVCSHAKRWRFSIACWKIHMDGGRGVPWKSVCVSNGSCCLQRMWWLRFETSLRSYFAFWCCWDVLCVLFVATFWETFFSNGSVSDFWVPNSGCFWWSLFSSHFWNAQCISKKCALGDAT